MKKYIFFHNPKCGGSTTHSLLPKEDWHNLDAVLSKSEMSEEQLKTTQILGFHSKPHHYTPQQHINMGIFTMLQMKNAYKFTFVRNPFDKLVSEYHNSGRITSFEEFIHRVKLIVKHGQYYKFNQNIQPNHLTPQYKYVYGDNNLKMVDYVGRLENYNSNINDIFAHIELEPPKSINRVGPSKNRRQYQDYYTKNLIQIVEKVYEKDFNLFNYEF